MRERAFKWFLSILESELYKEKTGKTTVSYLCFPIVTIEIEGGIKDKVRSIF